MTAPRAETTTVPARARAALATRGRWQPAALGPAQLVCELKGGLSNHNLLFHCAQQWLVLRLDRIDTRLNRLDRELEYRIMRDAARAGLAPRPRYLDSRRGVLVHDYVGELPATVRALPERHRPQTPGRRGGRPAVSAMTTHSALAALLRAIHRLPPRAPRLQLAAQLAHYQSIATQATPLEAADAALARSAGYCAAKLDRDSGEPVLCHNDLLWANRVWHQGRLLALDWEYAASGSRWFDLAVASSEQPEAAALGLLEAYLGRPSAAWERELLRCGRCLHAYLSWLWQRANTPRDAMCRPLMLRPEARRLRGNDTG